MVTTGSETLDHILRGGYPENRTTLLTGSPGTGKSTLAMQFLQAGLEEGDDCLFISTEQTIGELRDTFAPFSFDLNHEGLTITSLHARTGYTIESTEPELVIETLDEGPVSTDWISPPFTTRHVQDYLQRHQGCDRVVLDSVSALEPMAEDRNAYRRSVLDLIDLFTTDFDATTVFTSEFVGQPAHESGVERVTTENVLQYNVHGVVRLWREQVRREFRRFLDVLKMRGVDHDTRRFELSFNDEGVRILPRVPKPDRGRPGRSFLSSGVDGFDDLLGGGFLKGTGALLEHDGQANIGDILAAIGAEALTSDMGLVIVPRVDTPPRRVDEFVRRSGIADGCDELLGDNRLFVLDALGAWRGGRNVFEFDGADDVKSALSRIKERHGDGLLLLFNTEAKVHALEDRQSRELRYWLQSQLLEEDDLLFDIHNPKVMKAELGEFYTDAATQVAETWIEESGLQYVQLKKGPLGEVGSVRLLDRDEEFPNIRLE